MYHQPETEDMLPRMAPTPSASVPLEATEGIIRPQVPEVSVLFGQQDVSVENQQLLPKTNEVKPTYEAWKKQILPKLTFPPSTTNMPDYSSSRVNLYPFRSVVASDLNPSGLVHSANNPIMYRRSLESCNGHTNYPQLPSQQSPQQTFPPTVSSRDVLTICAGTQTDKVLDTPNFSNIPMANLATKKDIDDIRQMLKEMQQEQQGILKILEVLILNPSIQTLSKPQTRDVGIQNEIIVNDNQLRANGNPSIPENESNMQTPKTKFMHQFKFSDNVSQTPKDKPIAQSTTYQPNSPNLQRLQHKVRGESPVSTNQHAPSKPNTIVQKSASDTSLAMNELAMKYLPNEKLAELLKELNMDCPLETVSTIPTDVPKSVKLNENKFEKETSDISNASYKYLKKYRLLSEDHEQNYNINNINDNLENENHIHSYNLPYGRNTNDNQRQTPIKKNSPFTGRLPLSPLARPPPPLTSIPPHIVNLENIKQQPKFL